MILPLILHALQTDTVMSSQSFYSTNVFAVDLAWRDKSCAACEIFCDHHSCGFISHVFLSGSLLWLSHKVNSFQFSLNWDDSLSCNLRRDARSEISDSCSHTWVLSRDLNKRSIYLVVYDRVSTLEYDEMSCSACLALSSIVVHMLRFCRDVCSDSYFAVYDRACMFVTRSFCRILRFLFHMLESCRDVYNNSYLAVCDRICMLNLARRSIDHLAYLLYLTNICFAMLFIKVLDQMRFTSKIRSEIVCMSDVSSITLFDLQYFRIDSKMRFTSKCSIRSCFTRMTISLSLREIQATFVS